MSDAFDLRIQTPPPFRRDNEPKGEATARQDGRAIMFPAVRFLCVRIWTAAAGYRTALLRLFSNADVYIFATG
jgi:hypothetical protein